jgi:hypothetical protein
MLLTELLNNVQQVDKQRLMDETFQELRLKSIELNQLQLLYGLNADGKKFRKYKNAAYAKKKNGMNSRPGFGNPDLKGSFGSFWSDFKADVKQGLEIYSTNQVAGYLEDGTYKMKPFDKIYGLTKESLSTLRKEFLIIFNSRLRAELGLQ